MSKVTSLSQLIPKEVLEMSHSSWVFPSQITERRCLFSFTFTRENEKRTTVVRIGYT